MNIVDERIDPTLAALLRAMEAGQASDLHLVPGYRPVFRVHGRLAGAQGPPLETGQARSMIESILPAGGADRLASQRNLDCSVAYTHDGRPHRFRVNVFHAQAQLCACFRYIPEQIPSFEWLGFSRALADRITHLTHGLVIVTGVTGSGKSTTLAAMVQLLNAEGGYRIITVEEPIEYVFPPALQTVITQREVGADVPSFAEGLRSGLRQDPDVVLVGEIRDRETAQMALSAAETGHLILTTLHTQDAKGAVTRLTDLFPHDVQDDVRTQLALSLRYVIAQHLLPNKVEGQKRALALEVMGSNHAVRAAIRDGKIQALESAIQMGKKDGMLTLDDSLHQLLAGDRITSETALRFSKDPEHFAG
ncbi:MAG: type IV pilus twitching motility protein PilT [Phycisphaerae bacterium]